MQRVVILGGGGHAHVVIEILREHKDVEVVGFLDPAPETTEILGAPHLGDDAVLAKLARERGITGVVPGIGDNRVRQKLFEHILRAELTPFTAIHPRATISPSASIGRGVVIMAHSVLNAMCRIG